jgi:Protein of unknown function (DUF3768)
MDQTMKATAIAALNDQCRQALGMRAGGRGVQNPGYRLPSARNPTADPPEDCHLLGLHRGRGPHGEHDFGAIDLPNVGKVSWKIDYYAADMERGSKDPADPTQTERVLTIMLASED